MELNRVTKRKMTGKGERNTYRLLRTLGLEKSEFTKRIGGLDSTPLHRQNDTEKAVERQRKCFNSLIVTPTPTPTPPL